MAAARGYFNLTSSTTAPTMPAVAAQSQSWRHSPVPYLFGGLAAMLGLIAFALLILACSYWRLSGYFNSRDGTGSSSGEHEDLESGEHQEGGDLMAKGAVYEEKVLVIMAGEKEPRFLATPLWSSRSSSFGDSSSTSSFSYRDEKSGKLEVVSEDLKQETSLQPENYTSYRPDSEDHDATDQTRDGTAIQDHRGE
ncbi:protein GLUTAMINE DUMPER 1-like [Punica granatum]|uniref:Uncharacterized protein n=2 Tax=Punica granatum TaxID=22663 RepID=A0A218W095_PUNGR|nr:protein GLUTAMINE DUMPER 1-like [Punica granatum]OWM65888.1 hypothetical protein CDL15_Pgr015313 [Punica granatum]PKI79536.1 hypothetical protein CRG98_000011 [Punica granatum]